jgi:hypothetical protein
MIYGGNENEVPPEQRFIGKTTVLGAGYGMGAIKFQAQLKNMGKDLDYDTCRFIIKQYRQVNRYIADWWNQLNMVLVYIINQKPVEVDRVGVRDNTLYGHSSSKRPVP